MLKAYVIRLLGYKRVHLPLCKVADTPFHVKNTPLTLHYFLCATTTFYAGNGELLLIQCRPVIMVGLWYYNQSGVTELLIIRDTHYGQKCFKSAKTLGALHS